jgi:hypothetical protein
MFKVFFKWFRGKKNTVSGQGQIAHKASMTSLNDAKQAEKTTHNDSAGKEIIGAETEREQIQGKLTQVYDATMLDHAREYLKIGDWDTLAKIGETDLEHHPDRAKLALLVAAGYQQKNDLVTTRWWLKLAQEWGCDKRLVAKILIAGAYNTLGVAACINKQEPKATFFFERAIGTGFSTGRVRLAAEKRMSKLYQQMRLTTIHGGEKQKVELNYKADQGNVETDSIQHYSKEKLTFSAEAYEFYRRVSEKCANKAIPPFILLDSKSLPRSGLHYMKNTLAKILQETFSFCEWYQEPGCCKKMPCALTGYAEYCLQNGTAKLRLTKSHDFALDDPVFEPIFSVRRIVLVRNPLFVLTSWFMLEHLAKCAKALEVAGIKMEKIWLAHEPEVMGGAYNILNENFKAPSREALHEWLEEKRRYIHGFMQKWVPLALDTTYPHSQLIHYENINSYIIEILDEFKSYLSVETVGRIDTFAQGSLMKFQPRDNAFATPSDAVSSFLMSNAHLFKEEANIIIAEAPKGVFSNDVSF